MCFTDRYRSDHNSAIPIAFCLFGSIVGFLPSSARLQFSAQRRSSAGIAPIIGAMSRANHFWGAPHIHGELLKLGFTIAQSTVARYKYRGWPPSQGCLDLPDQSCLSPLTPFRLFPTCSLPPI